MSVTRRYTPEWGPDENSVIGMDFSFVIPPGVGITEGLIAVYYNTANPTIVPPTELGSQSGVSVQGRTIYCTLHGGIAGTDYQLRWTAIDTDGNIWPRTALLLCSLTS